MRQHVERETQPLFELQTFLDGHCTAWGVFEDRFGRVRRRFEVRMFGRTVDGVFFLDEAFAYDDGTREHRTWRIDPVGHGQFTAQSNDCVGVAHGRCEPDRLAMRYRFRLKLKTRTLVADFDDRIYKLDDRRAINRTVVSKWGIKLGEVTLFFERNESIRVRRAA